MRNYFLNNLNVAIICSLLVCSTFAVQRQIDLHYSDDLELFNLTSGVSITVNVTSLPGNDQTIPITLQFRERADLNDPLTSAVLDTQTCTFVSGACQIIFNLATATATSEYLVRLSESTVVHHLEVHAAVSGSRHKIQRQFLITPEGSTNPGFIFYAEAAGSWTANFTLESTPAPTISAYNFNLFDYDTVAGTLTTDATTATVTATSVTFDIAAAGFYFVSLNLAITTIDSTVRYPLGFQISFIDNICPSGDYFSKSTGACSLCSTLTNAIGTTTNDAICDCATGYIFNRKQELCVSTTNNGNMRREGGKNHGNGNQNGGQHHGRD